MAESARNRIHRASLELFGRKGIAGTTVKDIAKRARCSEAAIYKYWDSKDKLARELFEESYEELLSSMKAQIERWTDPAKRVTGAAQGFLDYARRHPAKHAFLFQVFHSDYVKWTALRERPFDIVEEQVRLVEGVGREGSGSLSAMVLGMAIRLALSERQQLIREERSSVDAALARGIQQIFSGLP